MSIGKSTVVHCVGRPLSRPWCLEGVFNSRRMLPWVFLLCILNFGTVSGQLSDAVAKDGDMKLDPKNKFLNREASKSINTQDNHAFEACPTEVVDLTIRWHAEVTSSVHATPLITDLYNDGHKDILVPGLKKLDLISGRSGAIDTDFETSQSYSSYSSPLLYDVDYDGVLDILLPSYNGRIHFMKDTGADALYGLNIPRLKVKRDWFEGLRLDPNDHSDPDVQALKDDDSGIGERENGKNVQEKATQRRSLLQVEQATVEERGHLTDEASQSFSDLFDDQNDDGPDDAWLDDPSDDAHADYNELPGKQEETPVQSEDTSAQSSEDDYFLDYQSLYDTNSKLWKDDTHSDDKYTGNESPFVWIDPHIQTTPVIGDIDGDGSDDLVLAVSYFFDQSEYSADSLMTKMAVGENGDIMKYLASGVVVYDLNSRMIKWSQHLDLSTAYTRYKAASLSSPALADVNGDGMLEVIVGTSMGFLYVLDAKTGNALDGWPIQMGDIQGHVAVADIDQDGKLEIVAADTRGSVAAFRGDATEVWELHIGSAFTAGVTFGDVDGDGQLEASFATMDGKVYLVDAATGKIKPGWPFRTFGEITAPVLITKVDGSDRRRGMQLVVTSHDGYLYVIDNDKMCTSSLNMGEPSNAMVLTEDLTSSGEMDLLVSTVRGNIYSIRTTSQYHPLKTRNALFPGLSESSYVTRWNWAGIYASAGSRIPRDVRGANIQVRFTVMDKRASSYPKEVNGKLESKKISYKISAILVGVGAREMNAGDHPIIGLSQTVNASGTYTIELPTPRSRTTASIRLEWKDEHGSIYVDEFPMSFHVHFYRLLKWLVVGPMSLMSAVLLATLGDKISHAQLPS